MVILEAQNQIVRNVNSTMVLTYFQIGHYIAEDELKGKDRADYAERIMRQLSLDLTNEFGKGYSNMRQFYKIYQSRYKQIVQPLIGRSKKPVKIVQSPIGQSSSPFGLSWTHYIQLLKIGDNGERTF